MDFRTSQPLARHDYAMCAMRWLLLFLVILILIGGGLKMAGANIPGLDFPFGGLFGQPQIEIQQPDLHLP